MIAFLLSSLKGETLTLELRGGSPVRVGSGTNLGDKLSGVMKDQVLLLLLLRDCHLQSSSARSQLFPAFAEDSTSCTSANALWMLLESSARSWRFLTTRENHNIHSVVIDSSSAWVIYGVLKLDGPDLRYQLHCRAAVPGSRCQTAGTKTCSARDWRCPVDHRFLLPGTSCSRR